MNVVRTLVRSGHDVTATRRPRGNTLFARRLGAPLIRVELDDVNSLCRAMQNCEVVFMCAGHYPRYSLDKARQIRIARTRMRAVLDAAQRAGVLRLVLTSSVATVGKPRPGRSLSDEQDRMEPRSRRSVYFAVKAAIEEEALTARRGLGVVVLCPGAVLGELDVKAGTGHIIVAIANRKLPFYTDGLVNVIDADDLARAHIAAAVRGRPGERYLVGGHNLTVRNLLEAIARSLGVPFDARRLPARVTGMLASLSELQVLCMRNGARPLLSRELVDVVRFGRCIDTSKASRELELEPPTALGATLEKACGWYQRHGYMPGHFADITNESLQNSERTPHASDEQRPDPTRPRSHHPSYSPESAGRNASDGPTS